MFDVTEETRAKSAAIPLPEYLTRTISSTIEWVVFEAQPPRAISAFHFNAILIWMEANGHTTPDEMRAQLKKALADG